MKPNLIQQSYISQKRFMAILVMCVLAVCLSLNENVTFAQAHSTHLIYSSNGIFDVTWSIDNTSFTFYDYSANNNLNWRQYHLDTGQLTMSKDWPLKPTIGLQAQKKFQYFPQNGNPMTYPSPNGRFLVYFPEATLCLPDPPDKCYISFLGIIDLATQKYVITDIRPEDETIVRWSNDSSALTISTAIQTFPRVYYVTHLSDLPYHIYEKQLENISYQDHSYSADNVLDISDHGDKLLLSAFHQAYLYDVTKPSDSIRLPGNDILGGAIYSDGKTLGVLTRNSFGLFFT